MLEIIVKIIHGDQLWPIINVHLMHMHMGLAIGLACPLASPSCGTFDPLAGAMPGQRQLW